MVFIMLNTRTEQTCVAQVHTSRDIYAWQINITKNVSAIFSNIIEYDILSIGTLQTVMTHYFNEQMMLDLERNII